MLLPGLRIVALPIKRDLNLFIVYPHVMLLELALFRLQEAVKLLDLSLVLIQVHDKRSTFDLSRAHKRRYFGALGGSRSCNILALMNFLLVRADFRFLLAKQSRVKSRFAWLVTVNLSTFVI